MRYSEKWLRHKRSSAVPNGRLAYYQQVRAITTDEAASCAIRAYWHQVAQEWQNGEGILWP